MPQKPRLFIVSIPIGNPADITLRAIETLRNADVIICEEKKEASILLKRLEIAGKELISLNEHNENELVPTIIFRMMQTGQQMALISDCGTPVFSDPGAYLIRQAVEMGISVSPIPGPSSLMAALSILDHKLDRFIYAGFLPREAEQRQQELNKLKGFRMPIIIMDTPYRLVTILEAVSKTYGKGVSVTLACDLTLPNESIYRGTIGDVKQQVGQRKAEFILIIESS